MTIELLEQAISCIDEDLIEKHAAMRYALSERKRRPGVHITRRLRVLASCAACLLIVCVVGLVIPLSQARSKDGAAMNDASPGESLWGKGDEEVGNGEITTAEGTQQPSAPTDSDGMTAAEADMPITAEEIDSLDAHLQDLLTLLSETQASGADESFAVIENGYDHLTVNEDGTVIYHRSYLDLPVVNAQGEIVAIITVYRYEGHLKCQMSYGGANIEKLNTLLRQYAGQDIVMLYVGDFSEVAITPDGEIHTLAGSPGIFAEDRDYYNEYRREGNILNSEMLQTKE